MTGSCGKWLSIKEYAESAGVSEAEAKARVRAGGFMLKFMDGREYVWLNDFSSPEREVPIKDRAAGLANQGEAVSGSDAGPDEGTGLERQVESDPEALEGEALVSRFTGAQELVHQAERAISLVERSLNTFMMMHQEVVSEKERIIELSRQGDDDYDRRIAEQDQEIAGLVQKLREKEQELADLRMLVEVLEGRLERTRSTPESKAGDEKASVGDMMEDQLRYIMEDQMVKELLKE